MNRSTWKVVFAALLAGVVAASCGTQARWVNCEGRLEPINPSAPKTVGEPLLEEPAKAEPASP